MKCVVMVSNFCKTNCQMPHQKIIEPLKFEKKFDRFKLNFQKGWMFKTRWNLK